MASAETMRKRMAAAARAMGEEDLDVLFIPAGPNVFYYGGVKGGQGDRLVALLVSVEGESVLIAPAFEADRIREESPSLAIRVWQEHEDPHRLVAEVVSNWGLERGTVGLDGKLWLQTYYRLREVFPRTTFKDASALLERVRIIKSEEEIQHLRKAGGIVREALRSVLGRMRPGTTEKEMAEAIVERISEAGAGAWVLVQSGPTASLPHAPTGPRRFEAGDLVVIDCGAIVEGYSSDVTRTLAVGEPSDRGREIYRVVREAQAAAMAACRPGIAAQEVDRAARAVIEKAGYGKYFTHRTGHGIGLEVHEPPYLVEGNTQTLEPGMTFTVEPGIYIPGELGVRLEDDILITAAGSENLTPFPKEVDRI